MIANGTTSNLERFGSTSRPTCRCGVMLAECAVPVGAAAVPACWVCAHDYVEHDRPIGGGTSGVPCGCPLESIYPPDVVALRRLAATVTSLA